MNSWSLDILTVLSDFPRKLGIYLSITIFVPRKLVNPSEVRHLHVGPILLSLQGKREREREREREQLFKWPSISEWFFHDVIAEKSRLFWFADDIHTRSWSDRAACVHSCYPRQFFSWMVKLCVLLSTNNRPTGNYKDILC